MQLYNQGGENPFTSSAGPQLNDFSFSRFAVIEAAKKKVFSQSGAQRKQQLHFGTKIKKYRKYPILDDRNINDQGVDGAGVKMTAGMWYAYTADGTRTEHATMALAKASAGQVRIWKGDGNLYGSSRDFNVQNGAFPILGEEGGNVNVVGTMRDVLEAQIRRYGFVVNYSKTAMKLDTDPSLLMEEIQKVAEAYGDIRESQIRNGLITVGMQNATYSGGATSMNTVDETCQLNYGDLRLMTSSLNTARCPMDTKMVVGSTKIDTVVINAARYAYIPQELLPTLQDMTQSGKTLWADVAEYADGDNLTDRTVMGKTNVAEGEVGRIGEIRFIVVYDFPAFYGAGADATDGADGDGDGIEDVASNIHVSDDAYDVFPILFVGSDSFETYSLEGEVAKVKHGEPRVIPQIDPHGDRGSIAIEWWFGLMINKAEHIRVLLTAAKVV